MKAYKLVHLNSNIHLSRQKDLDDATEVLNSYIMEGWKLEQIVTPSDGLGTMVAVLYIEVEP